MRGLRHRIWSGCFRDPEGRVRRRAALAVGRVGLVDGVEPLLPLLADADVEVRQMAAFALGSIGHASARAALTKALDDPEPIVRVARRRRLVQSATADADVVSGIVRRHIGHWCAERLDPDDLTYPLSAPAEAARLAIYALVRLGSYDALAAAVLDGSGQPVSRWWPVAYALGRINDPRAAPGVAARCCGRPGRYTAAFSARGLAALKAPQRPPLSGRSWKTVDGCIPLWCSRRFAVSQPSGTQPSFPCW